MSPALSETSALVLIYDGGDSYQTPKSRAFYNRLDLTPGQSLYRKLSHLSHIDRVIKGRKYSIHGFLKRFLKNSGPSAQVIVFGCGWDPVLVKMSEKFPENFFIGVDRNIDGQEELVRDISPESRISYMEWDMAHSKDLLRGLREKGWNPDQPLCVVLEGIIYYVPPDSLWKTVSSLKNNSSSYFSLAGDYLVDLKNKDLTPRAKKMGYDIFETIKRDCGLETYYMYSRDKLRKKALSLKYSSVDFLDIHTMEIRQKGVAKFQGQNDCHIELFFASDQTEMREMRSS